MVYLLLGLHIMMLYSLRPRYPSRSYKGVLRVLHGKWTVVSLYGFGHSSSHELIFELKSGPRSTFLTISVFLFVWTPRCPQLPATTNPIYPIHWDFSCFSVAPLPIIYQVYQIFCCKPIIASTQVTGVTKITKNGDK